MNLYTIGFTKKTAKEFFELLIKNKIKKVIDIRLISIAACWVLKKEDLKYFLKKIANIDYIHNPDYAPTEELLKDYRKKIVAWNDYEKRYIDTLEKREILSKINYSTFKDACLLCSESKADLCHRRLFAEYLKKHNHKINIIHL